MRGTTFTRWLVLGALMLPCSSLVDASVGQYSRAGSDDNILEQLFPYNSIDECYDTARRWELSLATDPEALEPRLELLHLTHQLAIIQNQPGLKGEQRELYERETLPLLLNNVEHARVLASRYIALQDDASITLDSQWNEKDILTQVRSVFQYPYQVRRCLGEGEDTLELLRTLGSQLRTLYPLLLEASQYEEEHLYAQTVVLGIRTGVWWEPSVQQYFDDERQWLDLAIDRAPRAWSSVFHAACYFEMDYCPLWTTDEDTRQRYMAFVQELLDHPHPVMRASAHHGLVFYYAKLDEAKTAEHFQAFIDTVVEDLIPAYPEWGHEMGIWNPNHIYSAQKAVGLRSIAESHARIISEVLHHSPRFAMGLWRDIVLRCCKDLEREGETDQAIALLTTCLDRLQSLPSTKSRDIETVASWLNAFQETPSELGATAD